MENIGDEDSTTGNQDLPAVGRAGAIALRVIIMSDEEASGGDTGDECPEEGSVTHRKG